MQQRRFRYPFALAGALLVVVLGAATVTACSSDSDDPEVTDSPVADAKKAMEGKSASIEGTIQSAGDDTPVTGVWTGTVAEGEGQATFEVAIPDVPSGEGEVRWTDGSAYVRRIPTETKVPGFGILPSLFHLPSERPWTKADAVSPWALFLVPFDPPTLLNRMEGSKTKALPGTKEIDGKDAITLQNTEPIPIMGWWAGVTVNMFVDDETAEPLRVQITSAAGGTTYDIEYGADVNVEPPPADEIAVAGVEDPIDLAGDYTEAASGADGDFAWQLLRADSTEGLVCWRAETTPPLEQVVKDRDDGARCLAPPPADGEPEQAVQFVVDTDGTGDHDMLAVNLPAGTRGLTLGYVGGDTETAPVTTPFVWVGPSSRQLAYLGVELPDGSKLDCGAGAVGSVGDLTDSQLTDHVASAPWACLPADA